MNAGTSILLSLWAEVKNTQAKGSDRYGRCADGLGFVDALEQAVSVLLLSQAKVIVEELENDLITRHSHAQSLADYIRKVKSI
jgi:hypothetical protein